MRLGRAFACIDPELQREVNGRVNEGGTRGIRNEQMRRDLAERQADFEMLGLNLQVPIFMLKHNGHFIGEAFVQMLRNGNAWGLSLESDVEMMVARQAVTRNIAEHAANNGAQCLLHNVVISNQAITMLIGHPC